MVYQTGPSIFTKRTLLLIIGFDEEQLSMVSFMCVHKRQVLIQTMALFFQNSVTLDVPTDYLFPWG